MSIKLMTMAFNACVGNPVRKLILIKLCDNANDDGVCWPSYSRIAEQCEVSKRCAMTHIKWLSENGFLEVENRFKNGNQTSNSYTISVYKLMETGAKAGEKYSPPSEIDSPPLVNVVHPPSEPGSPRTVIESSNRTIKYKSYENLDYSSWPEQPSEQTMADWLAMRKRLKANVSQTVINRFATELHKAKTLGYTVDQCLAECVMRNWRGFVAEWMSNALRISQGAAEVKVVTSSATRCRSLIEDLTDTSWAN